jgi:hypothetical protein
VSRDVLERGLADILNAERSLRRTAEGANVELRRVLTEIAYRTAGEALEGRRRVDPNAPEAWSAGQWREFFSAHLDKTPPGWGDPGIGRRRSDESAEPRDEITRRLSDALAELERLRQPQGGGDGHREIVPSIAATEPSADTGANVWPEIPKHPPARFADRLSRGLRWRREALFLHLIATKGWSTRLEILEVAGRLSKVSPRSGSLKRTFDALISNGLLAGDILLMALGRPSKLAVARLTEEGIELCRVLGWDPVESEWERLNRFHEGENQPAHTAGVLAFVYHARLRGWEAEVLPTEIDLETRPDVSLKREEKRIFVEVEFDGDKPAKWRNLANLQGFVAFCAPTPDKREGMVSDCRLAQLSGIATDLETLIQSSFPTSPLWVEEW